MADLSGSSALISSPEKNQGSSRINSTLVWKILSYAILIFGATISLFPFLWMISTSLMSLGEAMGSSMIPSELHFSNYREAWEQANFTLYFKNSVVITLITLAGELTFSILAAYAFARMDFPGKNLLFGLLLSTMMIPGMVFMIPNLLTIVWLGRVGPIAWYDNWPALTIPFMGSVFSIFLLRQFFAQIPQELFDAARIDGAGHLRFLYQVVLPLSSAPIMVIVVLSFIGSWNALAWPLLVTDSETWRPIAVGFLTFLNSDAGNKTHLIMAGSFITIVPILVLYFFTQRQFTESIARSGLKG